MITSRTLGEDQSTEDTDEEDENPKDGEKIDNSKSFSDDSDGNIILTERDDSLESSVSVCNRFLINLNFRSCDWRRESNKGR